MFIAMVIHNQMSVHLLYAYILESEREHLRMTHVGLDTECRWNPNIALLKVLMAVSIGQNLEMAVLVSGVDLLCTLS